MNVTRFASLFAAAAAMFSMSGTAQAQGLFGGYTQSYPASNAGSMQPCATGNCAVRGYPTNSYVTGYPTATCPTGTCPPGQCIHGVQSPQCRTICGPNGCQTICGASGMQCGPNGCVPAVGYGNVNSGGMNYGTAATLPSLNLDQTAAWNWNNGSFGYPGAYGATMTPNPGFNGAASFGQVAPSRSFARPGMNNGYLPASLETNIANDPMVRLN